MIRFLRHNLIDKALWDNCIRCAPNGNLNSWSWYLDIVSPGWCALVENDYEMVFPLPVSSKAGIKYIMQPYFTQQLGLFYQSLPTDNKLAEFLASIPPEYKYIDLNLNTSNKIDPSVNVSEMTNIELDMNIDYKNLASAYQTNLQRNLKKAAQNKLALSFEVKPEEMILLFRSNKGLELQHLKDSQYKIIQQIAKESIKRGLAQVWGVYDEYNQLSACALWVISHQKAIFLFSAVSEQGKKLNAMPWLVDSFIHSHAGKPLTLDFEGSNDDGLARFYCSFGAKKVTYQRFKHNFLPLAFQIALKIWRKSRRKLKLS